MESDQENSSSLSHLLSHPPPFIFVGGIHGVGKSTLCDSAFAPAGYHCVTASSLIRLRRSHSDREKLVDDIPDNQTALIEQLELEKITRRHLLLDGHFCLLNGEGEVEPIRIEVFEAMSPSALVLVKCDPKVVADRLTNRDKKEWCPEMLQQFQEAEEKHAKLVAKVLQAPLTIVRPQIRPSITDKHLPGLNPE